MRAKRGGIDPCILKVARGFIDKNTQKFIGPVVIRCMDELETFTPAQLKTCIEEEARIALPYDMFYNMIIRRLVKEGVFNKVKRGVYRTTDKFKFMGYLAEVLQRRVFESVMRGGGGGCVVVRLRLHVVCGSLLEAYVSLLVLRKIMPFALGILRGALRDEGFGEGELRRIERCVRGALKSARLVGFDVGGHRGKGRSSRKLVKGHGLEEFGVDLYPCVEKRYLPLFKHINFYKGEIVRDCPCQRGESHGGEAR
jgi:hypothetical protein